MATENFRSAGKTGTRNGRLFGVVWSGATTAGDTCIVTDSSTGRVIFRGQASGDNTFQGGMFPKSLHVKAGLEISQISSGEVILYFEDV